MPGALDFLKQRLAELDEQGLLLQPRTLEGPTGARARFDGRDVINLASNNYLGLANHPRMNAAAAKAASELGAGTGAVRTIAGSMTLHRELERRFAAFKHAEDALMFQSGFTANAGTVAAILDKQDVIVSDRLNHASIIDGARLSRAEIKVFEHKDAEHADRCSGEQGGGPAAAAGDGRRVLDGRGHRAAPRARRGGRAARRDHDGRRRPRVRRARTGARAPWITSACTGGWTSRWDALEGDRRPGRVHRRAARADRVAAEPRTSVPVLDERAARGGRGLHRGARHHRGRARADRPALVEHRAFKAGLHELGFDTGASETPITPVITGDEERTQAFARRLFDEGVFCPAIVFPTVARARRASGRSSRRITRRRI